MNNFEFNKLETYIKNNPEKIIDVPDKFLEDIYFFVIHKIRGL